jgi:PAS domain S-box-containing protein
MVSLEEQLFRLSRATTLLHAAGDLDELLDVAVNQIRVILGVQQAMVSLTEAAGVEGARRVLALSEPVEPWLDAYRKLDQTPLLEQVRLDRNPMRMSAAALARHGMWKQPSGSALLRLRDRLDGLLVVPIMRAGDETLGLLLASSQMDGDFSDSDQALLTQWAQSVSVALQNLIERIALRRTERVLKAPFEHALVGIWVLDRDADLVRVNPAFCRMLGTTEQGVVGTPITQWLAPEERQSFIALYREMLAGAVSSHVTTRHFNRLDGTRIAARLSLSAVAAEPGEVTRVIVISEDVTEQQQVESALRAAQQETEEILSSISDAFFNLDDDARFTYVNDAAERLLRRDRDSLIGRIAWDEFPEARGGPFEAYYDQARSSKMTVTFQEYYEALDAWFDVRAYPHKHGLSVYFRDVSAKVRAEQLARQQHQDVESALTKYQRIVEASLDVVSIVDADGCFLEVSNRARDVWGYDPEELLGRLYIDLVHPDDRELTLLEGEAVKSGRATINFRNRYLRKDGSIAHMLWSTNWSDSEQCYYTLARDVTDLVSIEERLRQSQRLEAVGQLTGGVAHDFNNLLTVILGSAEILLDQLPEDHRLRMVAEMTRSAAERGADLTRGLLAFARKQPLKPVSTDINKLVGEMDALLRRTLDEDIEIEIVRAGGLWQALVDPSQLESAILNLSLNARDAMPQGGRLTIETANVHLDDRYADQHEEVKPGQYVMIAVSDTGDGMSEEVAARAFEPFFTTKEVGKGSGLGLSMVFGFSKQSGGHVKIYTEQNHGTVVKVYLPRSGEPAETIEGRRQPEVEQGAERILLVEDDDLVRAHVEDQLRSLGYRVTAVENGAAALKVLRRHRDFDLLFTDVVMPGGVNGRELAEAAWDLNPELPVLFTSGYTENAIVHHGRLDRGVHLLNKPFRRQELAAKVRAVLREGGGRPGEQS